MPCGSRLGSVPCEVTSAAQFLLQICSSGAASIRTAVYAFQLQSDLFLSVSCEQYGGERISDLAFIQSWGFNQTTCPGCRHSRSTTESQMPSKIVVSTAQQSHDVPLNLCLRSISRSQQLYSEHVWPSWLIIQHRRYNRW